MTILIACNEKSPVAPTATTYQLTVLASAGGTITAPAQPTVTINKDVVTTITAHPNTGYAFSEWNDTSGNATIAYKNSASTTVKLSSGNATVLAGFIPVVSALAPVDISTFQKEQGLNFSYYKGQWTMLPDFSTLSPDSAGPCNVIDLSGIPHQSSNFGFVFNGYFNVSQAGSYTFYLKSSDGSVLLLNNSILINKDGVHASPVEDSASATLSEGPYLLEVRYFDAGSSPVLTVSYSCADAGIDKQVIPDATLSRPFTGPLSKIIVTKPAGGETYHLGDTIHVRWTYQNQRGQVFVSLSADDGKSYEKICNTAIPGEVNFYDWVIPLGADSLITQSALIKVDEYPPFNKFSVSNKFSIVK
jgi:hypothetical protein